ncbi:hypothetical protein OF829_07460 [Sphingomonas sp. LB-2]|uniref:hypothetical protein n=1 Tax=Sphingomonas caeni TaxID=2984949 RepID=UPI0022305DAE|nr:hypothetical protein [Sphingomonas caeni]MCW3847072.1 hypothetical protein [Sphingomonas caeni]
MPAPFNPARRNRNIGTAKQGHSQNNRMSIPGTAISGAEPLGTHRIETRDIQGKQVAFIVEKTSGGCVHACTIADIEHLLSHIPRSDWAGLNTFVLRQSTRKTRILNPAWGRLWYFTDLQFRGRIIASGPAIFLEAMQVDAPIKWSAALDPADAEELERLRTDGHRVERAGSRHIVTPNLDSARVTLLYRTLPHEIGHWFDWLQKVKAPLARGDDYVTLVQRYFARPKTEREGFAHRYADALCARLKHDGVIPFPRTGE